MASGDEINAAMIHIHLCIFQFIQLFFYWKYVIWIGHIFFFIQRDMEKHDKDVHCKYFFL